MVATLLKLKLRLLINSLKRSTAQLVAMIISLVVAGGAGLALLAGGVGASFAVPGHAATVSSVIILLGAAVVVGWAVIPPLFFGVDPTLDPQRFATLNVPRRSLATGLLLSGAIGVPGLLTLCFALASALVWLGHPAAMIAALAGTLMGALLAIAAARLVTAALSGALASRRGRDLAGVGGMLIVILLSLALQFVSQSMSALAINGDLAGQVTSALSMSHWVKWTPVGAPWAVGGAAAQGEWGIAAALLALTLGYLALTAWLWSRAMARSMVRPPSATASKGHAENTVLAFAQKWAWRPGWRQVTAVTARCLRYWRSDPRYLAQVVVMPLMPVMMIVIGLVSPAGPMMALAGPLLAAFVVSVILSNDTGYDSTAFWLHVFAPVKGRTDRAGRMWALCLWAVPLLIISIIVCLWVARKAMYWPAITGLTFALTFAGMAASLVASALATTPCPLPGESPMASKSGSGALKMAVAFGVMGACFLLSSPTIVFGVLSLVSSPAWGYVALGAGLVTAVACAIGGVLLGGAILDRRKLALLGQLVRQDS